MAILASGTRDVNLKLTYLACFLGLRTISGADHWVHSIQKLELSTKLMVSLLFPRGKAVSILTLPHHLHQRGHKRSFGGFGPCAYPGRIRRHQLKRLLG